MDITDKYFVYIVTDRRYGTLYVGLTNNLGRRIFEHKHGLYAGFTRKYGLKKLVYYEGFCSIEDAIAKEKKLKKWRRDWKIELIHSMNRDWGDLYETLNG